MHVSDSEENFKSYIALVLKLLMKDIDNLFGCLLFRWFVTFRYFPQLYPFRSRSRVFLRLRLF